MKVNANLGNFFKTVNEYSEANKSIEEFAAFVIKNYDLTDDTRNLKTYTVKASEAPELANDMARKWIKESTKSTIPSVICGDEDRHSRLKQINDVLKNKPGDSVEAVDQDEFLSFLNSLPPDELDVVIPDSDISEFFDKEKFSNMMSHTTEDLKEDLVKAAEALENATETASAETVSEQFVETLDNLLEHPEKVEEEKQKQANQKQPKARPVKIKVVKPAPKKKTKAKVTKAKVVKVPAKKSSKRK